MLRILRAVHACCVKHPFHLQEFAPELADLQVDASPLVRRYLAELLEEAAAAAPQPAVLQPVAVCLQALCTDGTASVAKRAVPAASAVFRTCFALVAAQATMLAIPLDSVNERGPTPELNTNGRTTACCKAVSLVLLQPMEARQHTR